MLRGSELELPSVALGCMRYPAMNERALNEFIHRALELEMNFFDHADIYGAGCFLDLKASR